MYEEIFPSFDLDEMKRVLLWLPDDSRKLMFCLLYRQVLTPLTYKKIGLERARRTKQDRFTNMRQEYKYNDGAGCHRGNLKTNKDGGH